MKKTAERKAEGRNFTMFSARLVSVAGIALTISLAVGAQERVLLVAQADTLVAQRSDEVTVATLKALHEEASQTGRARVIVGLRVPFSSESQLSAPAVVQQRDEIAQMQSAMLRRLPSLPETSSGVNRFETIPFVGLSVAPEELVDLINLPEVISIERDELAAPTLQYSVPQIGGNTVWASGYSGSGQTVAVLDTGVLKTHPFIQSKVVSEACYSTASGYNVQSVCPGGVTQSTAVNSGMPCDLEGCDHGTHVSGIVAGAANGQSSGVAKDARIIAIQVFSKIYDSAICSNSGKPTPCALSYTSDQIKALERVYSLRYNYNIASVNMSLGGGYYTSTCDSSQASRKTIIDQLASAGIATIISSGNSGYTDAISAPACISTAVSVGATWAKSGGNNNCQGNYLGTSNVDAISCYSNSSYFLSLLAPGSAIYSSILGNTYAYASGTSMAAPHVAGAWAVMKQKKPNATVTELLEAFKNTGQLVADPRNGFAKPRINLAAAINSVGGGGSSTPYHRLSVQPSSGGKVTSSPGGIDCGAACTASYPQATSVALTATPNPGYVFSGWIGACAGSLGVCNVAMNSPVTISASFTDASIRVTLIRAGQGQGTIFNNLQSCSLSPVCSFLVPKGTILSLTAAASSGSVFTGWSGDRCTGLAGCATTVNTEITIIANFNPDASSGKYVTPLTITNMTGAAGSIAYYSVNIPPGAKNLRFETLGGTGDVDLYVRYGQQPTLSTWDCRPWISGNGEICDFPTPAAGVYHAMLSGFHEYIGVNLVVSYKLGVDFKKSIIPLIFLLLED
ncbi:S8 family serine peptidase [uncultured Delftia sp.]|uniref:S8 family serine peptidase n=1 Tax=uncultured Delftia sp. TaxID=191464 RepID=UPI000B181EA4|nr:S8 family serine peptidase [uncultured Delftia sp.]